MFDPSPTAGTVVFMLPNILKIIMCLKEVNDELFCLVLLKVWHYELASETVSVCIARVLRSETVCRNLNLFILLELTRLICLLI